MSALREKYNRARRGSEVSWGQGVLEFLCGIRCQQQLVSQS